MSGPLRARRQCRWIRQMPVGLVAMMLVLPPAWAGEPAPAPAKPTPKPAPAAPTADMPQADMRQADMRPAGASPADGSDLGGLDDALLSGLEIPAEPRSAVPPPAKPAAPPRETDERSERGLIEQRDMGEDLGQTSEGRLASIGRQMRVAEGLIAREVTSAQTQRAQQQVIRDLEQLIEDLNQPSQDAHPGAAAPAQPGDKSSGAGRIGNGENAGVEQAARESDERPEREATDRAQLAQLPVLWKQIWGHLPPRVRDQMQSAVVEEFLPQYERLIEQYYSRLAEEHLKR